MRSRHLAVPTTAAAVAAAVTLGLAAPAAPAAAGPVAPAAVSVQWTPRATGLDAPTQVTSARDGVDRLFVSEQAGTVRVVRDGRVSRRPFLDIRGRVRAEGEGGLLSVAFHPRYTRRPVVFAAYTTLRGDLRVARFRAPSSTADRVPARTGRTVITVPHPAQFTNHFAGQLVFGPDGLLYLSTGDGGGTGDPGDRAQDRRSLQGKLLRLRVLGAGRTCGAPYCVPPANPFAGPVPGRGEIWATGLRNAWRFSIDPVSRDLWVADVGQDAFEEINRLPAGVGGLDLGWSCREGFTVYDRDRCRAGADYHEPEVAYGRDYGTTVTGGFVYRGTRYPELAGTYLAGDFGSGRVFTLGPSGVTTVGTLDGVTSFGEDDRRELWAVTYGGGLYEMRVP